jgi:hypothetical protein
MGLGRCHVKYYGSHTSGLCPKLHEKPAANEHVPGSTHHTLDCALSQAIVLRSMGS